MVKITPLKGIIFVTVCFSITSDHSPIKSMSERAPTDGMANFRPGSGVPVMTGIYL